VATPPVVVPAPPVSAGVVASGVPPAAGYNATAPTFSIPAVPVPIASAASSGVPPVFGGNGTSPTVPSLPQATGSASSVRVGGFMAAAVFGFTVFLL